MPCHAPPPKPATPSTSLVNYPGHFSCGCSAGPESRPRCFLLSPYSTSLPLAPTAKPLILFWMTLSAFLWVPPALHPLFPEPLPICLAGLISLPYLAQWDCWGVVRPSCFPYTPLLANIIHSEHSFFTTCVLALSWGRVRQVLT